jgi:predicted AlkP superfamily pyrophosphatase or phosphodiesterase
VDHAGHCYGYGKDIKQYMEAITEADNSVRKLKEILEWRKLKYLDEDWLVLVVTDHGGSMILNPAPNGDK